LKHENIENISATAAILEAVLFAAGEPIDGDKLMKVCAAQSPAEFEKAVIVLKARYTEEGSGITLLCLDGAYQLATKSEYAPYIREALELRRQTPLSPAAMEVLAIIAYNQPVSKPFVEQVRGVDSSSVVNSLYEKGLLEEAGRLDLPGRPIAYRTSEAFLRCFGISKLSELPPIAVDNEQLELEQEMSDLELELARELGETMSEISETEINETQVSEAETEVL